MAALPAFIEAAIHDTIHKAAAIFAHICGEMPRHHFLMKAYKGIWRILQGLEYWKVVLQMETTKTYRLRDAEANSKSTAWDGNELRSFLSIIPPVQKYAPKAVANLPWLNLFAYFPVSFLFYARAGLLKFKGTRAVSCALGAVNVQSMVALQRCLQIAVIQSIVPIPGFEEMLAGGHLHSHFCRCLLPNK